MEKLCVCCGNQATMTSGIWNFCVECFRKKESHLIIKCKTCGAYGFIPITPKSIFYFAESKMKDGVAMTNYCSVCHEIKGTVSSSPRKIPPTKEIIVN